MINIHIAKAFVIVIIVMLAGCATTQPVKPFTKIKKTKTIAEQYEEYSSKMSLVENKLLLGKLKAGTLLREEYLDEIRKKDTRSIFETYFEELLCETRSDTAYKKVVKFLVFSHQDSLKQLSNFLKNDIYLIVEENPRYIFPKILLANLYQETEEFNKALDQAKQIEQQLDNIDWAVLWAAEILSRMGRYDEAISKYETILSTSVNQLITYWENLIYLYWQTDKLNKVDEVCEKVISKSYDNRIKKSAKIICFFSAIKQRNSEKAIHLLSELTTADFRHLPHFSMRPNYPDFTTYQDTYEQINALLKNEVNLGSKEGSVYFILGVFEVCDELKDSIIEFDYNIDPIRKAAAFFKKGLENNPQNELFLFWSGLAYEQLKEFEQAKEQYLKISKNRDLRRNALVNLAGISREQRDFTSAIDFLKRAEEINQNQVNIHNEIGEIYSDDIEDHPKAIEWYKKSLYINPKQHFIQIRLAKSYFKNQQIEQAKRRVNSVIDDMLLREERWYLYLSDALKLLGDIQAVKKDTLKANQSYQRAVEYNPRNYDAKFSLASTYAHLGNEEEVDRIYWSIIDSLRTKEYRDKSPNLRSAYFYLQINHYNEPVYLIKLLDDAVQVLPGDVDFNRNLADAYREAEKLDQAIAQYKKTIKMDLEDELSYEGLAKTYWKKKQYGLAVQNLEKAIATRRNRIFTGNLGEWQKNWSNNIIRNDYAEIAKIYFEQEKYQDARDFYYKALSVVPDTTGVLYRFDIASSYFRSEQYDKAIENWQIVYDKGKDLNALFNIGISYSIQGGIKNWNKATIIFRKVLEEGEGKPEYRDILKKAKEFLEADQYSIDLARSPEKLRGLAKGRDEIAIIAELFLIAKEYNEINDLFIQGQKDTKPNKKFLEYSKEWIVTSYNVSQKIFQAESLCDRFKAKLESCEAKNTSLAEVKSLFVSAAKTRKEGIVIYQKGYYVKAKDYAGEYERGSAKIAVANQYFVDGLKTLKQMVEKHPASFSKFELDQIQGSIDYYTQ